MIEDRRNHHVGTKFVVGRRTWMSLVASSAMGLALVASHEDAQAEGAPRAEVLVIHASTKTGGSIDPKLGNLRQLKNPPFNAYNSFKLLDTKTIPLAKSGPNLPLPNGYNFSLSLQSAEGRNFRIVPSLSKTATPSPLPEVAAKADEPFFVAGQSYDGGILIIAATPRL